MRFLVLSWLSVSSTMGATTSEILASLLSIEVHILYCILYVFPNLNLFKLFLGCFRYGTGLNFSSNILEKFKTNSALECRERCRANSKCKLFNWNQESQNCFSRSEIPNEINVFISVKFAIVGLTDCSDVSILWPEYKYMFTSVSSQNTTNIVPKMFPNTFVNALATTTSANALTTDSRDNAGIQAVER